VGVPVLYRTRVVGLIRAQSRTEAKSHRAWTPVPILTAQAARVPSILQARFQFGFGAQAVFGDATSGEFAKTNGLQFLVEHGLA
jgi:hypothetical protein